MTGTLNISNIPELIEPYHVVATYGDNGDPGTLAQPWLTVDYAISQLTAGETLYIRAGSYHERIIINVDGTEGSYITIKPYPGETAIIDGEDDLPTVIVGLIAVNGDYIHIDEIELKNSAGDGIDCYGVGDWVNNCYVHHIQHRGMIVDGNYGIIEDCIMMYHNMKNILGDQPNWSSGISAKADYCILRRNICGIGYGEGMSITNCIGSTMEDNTIYDALHTVCYLSDVHDLICQRNLVYGTGYLATSNGITMGDEEKLYVPPSDNVIIRNNLVYGCNMNFYWWNGGEDACLSNVLVANNTFVNSIGTACVRIQDSDYHYNFRFINNIVRQDDALPVITLQGTPSSELHFSYNCWSKTPQVEAQGIGDIVDDADLAETDSYDNPLWYKILDTSPCRGAGIADEDVVGDYWETLRSDPPDMGAHEYI